MRRLLATAVLCLCAGLMTISPAQAQTATTKPKVQTRVEKAEAEKKEMQEWFDRTRDNYIFSRQDKLAEDMVSYRRYKFRLVREQGKEMAYIFKATNLHRPTWWPQCHSSSNISFQANIWGRDFMANYMPTSSTGFQAARLFNGHIQIVVSWRPSMVDHPDPAAGDLAKKHKLTKGHLQEAIVWHELGHNYVTYFLPVNHVITLYNDHHMLFEKLQEFYADLTSMYHSSPRGRLAGIFLRLRVYDNYDETEAHSRAAHAIGSLILSKVLSEPTKWPSLHFPPKVPDKNVERATIEYVYRHIDPNWTLGEDQALRKFIYAFVMKKGQSVLRMRGTVPLENRLSFKLMVGEDRKLQKKRDKWVAARLKDIIASGRADKPTKDDDKNSSTRPARIIIIKDRDDVDIELN